MRVLIKNQNKELPESFTPKYLINKIMNYNSVRELSLKLQFDW